MKIIFLDIDGVLVTQNSTGPWKFDPICVKRFKKILKATDAKIVISSTWRFMQSIDELRVMFNSCGLDGKRIFDTTPKIDLSSRGAEIARWLSENNRNNNLIENFIVIDDDNDISPFEDKFINTTWEDGISEHNVEHAIFLLEGK